MRSQRQIIGKHGIGVQIIGNGNTVAVYARKTELLLSRKHIHRAPPVLTELQLLRVDLRATTLVGRDRECAALKAWLDAPSAISVRCIAGRAGIGKTRLAIELCDFAEQIGWTAGFTTYMQFPEFVKRAAEWQWNKSTLVVVDYAASYVRDLRTWFDLLVGLEDEQKQFKLRVLLLDRHAERDNGWWAPLCQ